MLCRRQAPPAAASTAIYVCLVSLVMTQKTAITKANSHLLGPRIDVLVRGQAHRTQNAQRTLLANDVITGSRQ